MRTVKKKKLTALILALAVFLTGVWLLPALASNLTSDEQTKVDDYKTQQAEIQTKIDENQAKLDSLKNDIDHQKEYISTLQDQISTYQRQIDVHNENIRDLEEQKSGIQKKIDALDDDIRVIETEINHNELEQIKLQQQVEDIYDEFKTRLSDMYKYGRTSTLELLLNSRDFHSFLITLEISSNMAKHDEQMIDSLNQGISEIEALNVKKQELVEQINVKKAEHEAEIASLSAKQTEIEAVRNEVKTSQDKVMVLEAEAREYLAKLDSQSEEYIAIMNRYEDEIEAFDKKIDSIIAEAAARHAAEVAAQQQRAAAAAASTGSSAGEENAGSSGGYTSSSGFIWPLQYGDVYISSNYGYRTDPATGSTRFHGGTDTCCWSGTAGKSVRAAASGTVIVATYMAGGYGNYVVLDHGNGYTTVYGHNTSLNVYVGQYVNQGDVIAYAGSTGYATGAHCHFEIRVNNERVNPLNYCSP